MGALVEEYVTTNRTSKKPVSSNFLTGIMGNKHSSLWNNNLKTQYFILLLSRTRE